MMLRILDSTSCKVESNGRILKTLSPPTSSFKELNSFKRLVMGQIILELGTLGHILVTASPRFQQKFQEVECEDGQVGRSVG